MEAFSFELDALLGKYLVQAVDSGLLDGFGRTSSSHDGHSYIALPKTRKALSIAWHGQHQPLSDLASECCAFVDEVPSMANKNTQVSVDLIKLRLSKPESIDGCPVNCREIMIIRFVTRVGWLTKLFCGERVDDTSLEASVTERSLNGLVIVSGSLDGHDKVV